MKRSLFLFLLLCLRAEACLAQMEITLKAVKKLPLEASPYGQVKMDSGGSFYVLKPIDHSIIVYDSNMRYKHRIGNFGQGPGELSDPWDFAIDSSRLIYVADTGNNRIQVFAADGKFLRSINLNYRPDYVAVNDHGEIFGDCPRRLTR